MNWTAICTILAILFAPLIALRISVCLDERKESKKRKLDIFRALMSTRATTTNPIHVEALNRIDIEFYSGNEKDKKVTNAWKYYHDHLNDPSMADNTNQDDWKAWNIRSSELLTDLLSEMADNLGYVFDKVQIKRGHYFPKGLTELVDDQAIIRKGFADILSGKKLLPVWAIIAPPPPQQETGEDTAKEYIENT